MKRLLIIVLLTVLATSLCAQASGPTVAIPQGEYLVGVDLPAGTYTIHLPAGAMISFGDEPVTVLAYSEPELVSAFQTLDQQFHSLISEISGYKDIIALCNEYDELLTLLTSENNGLSSSDSIDKKVRYNQVKTLIRGSYPSIVSAKDGDLEGFKAQVDRLRQLMTVLLGEAQSALQENLKQQASSYAESIDNEKEAQSQLQAALDRQSKLVQLILGLSEDIQED